jgi:hypothetical protein
LAWARQKFGRREVAIYGRRGPASASSQRTMTAPTNATISAPIQP